MKMRLFCDLCAYLAPLTMEERAPGPNAGGTIPARLQRGGGDPSSLPAGPRLNKKHYNQEIK